MAPIADQMLLGLDFLRPHGATVDLGCNHLTVKGEVVPAVSRLTPDGPVSVARVSLPRRTYSSSSYYSGCDPSQSLK